MAAYECDHKLVFTSYIYSFQEEHSVVLHFANSLSFFLNFGVLHLYTLYSLNYWVIVML